MPLGPPPLPPKVVFNHRPRSTRDERAEAHHQRVVSGLDLPEVVPWQDDEKKRPWERMSQSHAQVVLVDTTEHGDKLDSRFSMASTYSPPKKSSTGSTSFRTRLTGGSGDYGDGRSCLPLRRRTWLIILACIVALAVLIAVGTGVGIAVSQKNASSAKSAPQNGTPTSSGASASGTDAQASAAAVGTGSPSATAAAPSSTVSVCPQYVGPSITQLSTSIPGPISQAPANTFKLNVQFASGLAYPLVAGNPNNEQEIFGNIPPGIAFALDIDASEVQMGALIPNDTSAMLCYIQTVAQVYLPTKYKETMLQYAFNWSSPLYHNPNSTVYGLMDQIFNMTFPLS